jgi:NAD(P)-dependent dehydrogenase (short-subunit alcohol dehydrogenase family)
MSFEGKLAIVTGAASGIGRETALAFARGGADLALIDIDAAGAKDVAAQIERDGGRASAHTADLSRPDEARGVLDAAVELHGRIDALAHVAAIYPRMPILELTEEHWDRVIDLNLRGAFFLSQHAVRLMLEREGGAIVNIASGAAFFPLEGLCAYSASKAGIIAVSRALALETARRNVRLNVVAPGPTVTEGIEVAFEPDQRRAMADAMAPGRWRTPQEIADAIVFLCSDAARGIHGAILNVNGGSYMP